MITYSQIQNICFLFKVHIGNEVILLPAVNKQQGKRWNYCVICCDDKYNGFYRGKPDIIPNLRCGTNSGGMKCYVLPIDKVEKFKELEDIDSGRPIGRYINKIVAKMRRQYGTHRTA